MVKDVPPLPPVLIKHYAEPMFVEQAIYNYIRYIEDIKIKNYDERQINTVCKSAVNIMKNWYLPNNVNIWNDNINSWLTKNQDNKIYHERILKIIEIS